MYCHTCPSPGTVTIHLLFPSEANMSRYRRLHHLIGFAMPATTQTVLRIGRTIALAGGVAHAAGCGTGPNDKTETVHYQFALAAFGADTTSERIRSYDCVVSGTFQVPKPVPSSGTARFPVTITRHLAEQRGTHLETTSADSSISEAVLEYTGLGGASLTSTFGAGSYVITLGPGATVATEPGEYTGPWSCDVAVPLAQDSTLGAYGFDPNMEIPGTWRISEERPIG